MANVKQVFKNFYVGNELLAKNRKELAFLLSECKKHGFKYKVSRSLNENYRYLVEAEVWQNSPKDFFIVSLREIEQWGVYNGEPMYAICGEIAELYNGNSRDEAFKVMQTWTDDLTKLIENHFDCVEGTPGFEKSLKNASLMLFVDEYLETVDGEDIYADDLCQIDANSCVDAYGEIKLSPIEIEEDLTPAQDEFFKDSVVRRKGKLIPVYHGTSSDFDEFVEESGLIWTTANKEYATEFSLGSGKVKEVYVNLTKPLVIGPTNVPFEEFMSYMIPSNRVVPSEQVKKLADKLNVSVDVLVDIFNSIDESVPKHKRRLFQVVNKPAFRQLVIDAGYDGVVCNEPVLTFGVVNANQLKYVNNENPTTSKKLNESDVEIELTDGKFYPGDTLDDDIMSYFMEDYSRLGADEALSTLQDMTRFREGYEDMRESVDDIFYRMWMLYDKEDVENKMDALKEMFFDWASEFFNPGVVAELKDEYFTVGMQFGFLNDLDFSEDGDLLLGRRERVTEDTDIEIADICSSDAERQIIDKLSSYRIYNIEFVQPVTDLNSEPADFDTTKPIIKGLFNGCRYEIRVVDSDEYGDKYEKESWYKFYASLDGSSYRSGSKLKHFIDMGAQFPLMSGGFDQSLYELDEHLTEEVEVELTELGNAAAEKHFIDILSSYGITDIEVLQSIPDINSSPSYFDEKPIIKGVYDNFAVVIGSLNEDRFYVEIQKEYFSIHSRHNLNYVITVAIPQLFKYLGYNHLTEDIELELSDIIDTDAKQQVVDKLSSYGLTNIEIVQPIFSLNNVPSDFSDGHIINCYFGSHPLTVGKYKNFVDAFYISYPGRALEIERNLNLEYVINDSIPIALDDIDYDPLTEDVDIELVDAEDNAEKELINTLSSYGITNIKLLQPIVSIDSTPNDFETPEFKSSTIIKGKYKGYTLTIQASRYAKSFQCELYQRVNGKKRGMVNLARTLSEVVYNKIPEAIEFVNTNFPDLTEDVEIEFEQTPGFQYKDITMQIANKLTDLGITDLQFYQPIYEGRFNALWFDDGTICTGRYKDFGVCIGAYSRYLDVRFGDEGDEIVITSMQDLDDLEVFDDEGYYDLYDCGSYEVYDEPELYLQIYDPANEAELLNSAEEQTIYDLGEIIDAVPGYLEYLEENIDEFKGYLTKPVEEDLDIELSEIPEENKSLEIKLANYQVHTFWTIFCEDGIYPAMDYLESKGYKVDDYYKNEPQDSDLLDYFYDWIKENFESKTFKVFEKCRNDEDWLAEGIEWENGEYIQFEPDTLYFEVKDIIRPLPEVLYHGTSEANAERIKETGGLALGQTSNWSASREDAIYLTTSKDDAYEYCNRVGLDNITILEIPVSALDLNKLYVDPNEEYYGEEDEDGKFYWDVFNFEYRDQISIDNIKFIEKNGYKLTEALSHNILFHRTTPTLAANILNDNELKVGGNYLFNLNRGKCICFSRDYNFIRNMSKQSNVVFVFNKDKLQTKYKLEPVSDTKNTGNNRARYSNNSKAEEVCFENITNVKDYLYKVVVSDAIYDSWLKFLEENGVEVDRSIFVKASDYRVNEELNNCRSKHSKCLTEGLVDLSNIEVYSFGDKKWNATSQELLDLAVEAGAPVDTSTEPEKRIISLENFDVFYPFEEYDLDENFHLYCLIGVIDEMEEAGIPFEYFDEEEEGTPNEYCMVDMLDLVQYGEDSGYDATVIPFEGQYVIYLHNDKPSEIGAIEITEDVDEPEIEFSQIETPQFTEITNKYKQLFESYGFTDIKFNKPIFEERQLALWYYDNNEPLVTMKYKDRYDVALVVDEMYYMHVNGGGWVKDIAEFEGEGLYTDKDIIDHTAYYEDSNETTIFEYEVDSRFWFRVHDSQNNNREIDNWFWIERCDDVWELAELNNALDDFDEFIKIYEEENGELLTVTEEVDNIELTNINPLEISDYVDTVDKLFQSVGHTPVYFPRTDDWGLKDETGQITWTGMSANSVIDMFEGEIDWLMEDWFDELDTYGLADKVPAARDEIYNWDEFLEVFGDKSIYNTPELKDFYDSHKFNIDAIDFMVNGREDFNLMLVPHDTDYDEYLDVELINNEEEE